MLIEGFSSSGHEREPTFWFGARTERLTADPVVPDAVDTGSSTRSVKNSILVRRIRLSGSAGFLLPVPTENRGGAIDARDAQGPAQRTSADGEGQAVRTPVQVGTPARFALAPVH